jgi:hypothetical protein
LTTGIRRGNVPLFRVGAAARAGRRSGLADVVRVRVAAGAGLARVGWDFGRASNGNASEGIESRGSAVFETAAGRRSATAIGLA